MVSNTFPAFCTQIASCISVLERQTLYTDVPAMYTSAPLEPELLPASAPACLEPLPQQLR